MGAIHSFILEPWCQFRVALRGHKPAISGARGVRPAPFKVSVGATSPRNLRAALLVSKFFLFLFFPVNFDENLSKRSPTVFWE